MPILMGIMTWINHSRGTANYIFKDNPGLFLGVVHKKHLKSAIFPALPKNIRQLLESSIKICRVKGRIDISLDFFPIK